MVQQSKKGSGMKRIVVYFSLEGNTEQRSSTELRKPVLLLLFVRSLRALLLRDPYRVSYW